MKPLDAIPASSLGQPLESYYVLRKGEILGPFRITQIEELMLSGTLNSADFVQQSGDSDWLPLREIIAPKDGSDEKGVPAPTWLAIIKWSWLRLRYNIDGGSFISGWLCLAIASLVILTLRWPLLIYVPWLSLACVCGIALCRRGRHRNGALILIIAAAIFLGGGGYPQRLVAHFKRTAPPSKSVASAERTSDSHVTPVPELILPVEKFDSGTATVASVPPELALPEKSPLPPVGDIPDAPQLAKESNMLKGTEQQIARPTIPEIEPPATPTKMQANVPVAPAPALFPLLNATVREVSVGSVDDAVYLVTTDKGSGSGFLVSLNGQQFLVTNYHVLEGASTAKFTSKKHEFELNGEVEVADDRDLVRIPVKTTHALRIRSDPVLEEKITVFGDPGGMAVITAEHGKLIGIGRGEIEVSAQFIPGNSGGPITDSRGEVVGVATYMVLQSEIIKWGKTGTRFEFARRFGVRIDDSVRWGKAQWDALSEDGKILAAVEGFHKDAKRLAFALFTTPYRARFIPKLEDHWSVSLYSFRQSYEGRVAAYNAVVESPLPKDVRSKARGHLVNLGDSLLEANRQLSGIVHEFKTAHTRRAFLKAVKEIADLGSTLRKNKQSAASGVAAGL